MNRGIYTLASGGIAALERLEAVAQNVANAATAGYKAERAVFTLRPLTPPASAMRPLDPVLGETAAQVVEAATVRDFAPGPIHPTGNPLDVAIDGNGFFVVSTARGERYTRQGSFRLDAEGYLATQHGDRVQGQAGDIRIGEGDATLGADGVVVVDGKVVDRLKLASFGERPGLVPEGAALFAPAQGAVATPVDADAVRLEPDALEAANVDVVTGMVELVDVARGFETYMHAMQRLDEIAQRSINDVGRV